MEGYGLSEMSPVTHFNVSFLYRIFGGRSVVYLINMTTKNTIIICFVKQIYCIVGQ